MPFGIRRFGSSSRFLQRFCVFALRLPLFRLIYVSATSLIEHKHNIFSRLVEPFSPSRFLGTMTSADFSRFVVTADFSVREISRDKSSVFPRLPSQFTHTGYGCLLDFVTVCSLIRRMRLSIRFLFVRLRFRYPFFSPVPRDTNLGSRFGVRRQLRPSWTFTTD